MLKAIIKSLFRPQSREAFVDDVLGKLSPAESGWTVRVSKGEGTFEFTIGGSDQPDAQLLAHARDILSNYEAFTQAVGQCITTESQEYPEDVKRELARLEIDNVSLCWPDRPNDGMIFFRGAADDVGCWRCDYIDRKPVGLGCDT